MSILDVIAKETNGIRQYSDQYQIRSNGSHTVHTVQERPLTPEKCPPLSDPDNLMLDSLYDYAQMHKGSITTLRCFCQLAYDRFSPKEVYSYLFWRKQYQDDDEQLLIIRIFNDLMIEDDDE